MAGAPEENRNAAIGDTNMDTHAKVAMSPEMKVRYKRHAKNVRGVDLSKLIRKLLDQDIERQEAEALTSSPP